MTTAVIAGMDPNELDEAFEDEDTTIVRVTDIASADSLSEAGIEDTDLLVFTDMDDVAAIVVAKEQNPDVCTMTYAYDILPELAKGQTDPAIGPNLLAVDMVAKELV